MPIIDFWKCGKCDFDKEASPDERMQTKMSCPRCSDGPEMFRPKSIIECDQCRKREVQIAPGWFRINLAATIHDQSDWRAGATGIFYFCSRYCYRKWMEPRWEKLVNWASLDHVRIDYQMEVEYAAFKDS